MTMTSSSVNVIMAPSQTNTNTTAATLGSLPSSKNSGGGDRRQHNLSRSADNNNISSAGGAKGDPQQQQQQGDSSAAKNNSNNTPRRGAMASKTNLKAPDITDVRQMEKGLLQLLDDFHSGKLQAFGKDCSFEKMDSVREQQEKLARLHFDLCVQQDGYNNPLSEEGRTIAKESMAKLMENLQQLSLSIEQLHSSTTNSGLQTEV